VSINARFNLIYYPGYLQKKQPLISYWKAPEGDIIELTQSPQAVAEEPPILAAAAVAVG
jgi:hypothetical protein